jgi:hypothetical protein
MIDKGLGAWPPEVVAAAEKFQQGDLIAKPPITYAASLLYPIWEPTRLEAAAGDAGPEPAHIAVHPDDLPPFGIITSQTCDIAEVERDPAQPWFDVSPVVLCETDDELLRCDYAYPLPEYDAPVGKCYVADLRLSVPLEKGLLVGQKPIDPFGDSEEKRIAFGRLIGERRARPALAESIHEFVTRTLNGHKRKTGKRVKKRLFKLMLQIQEGERLNPRAVKLHVITVENSAATIDIPGLEAWFHSWCEEARTVADSHGVALIDPEFHDAAKMDITLYDRLIEIRIPM